MAAVDLIKIDTQGFQAEVFEGAARVISEIRPRLIQMEFNWHQMFRSKTLNDFAEMLPGYDVYQLLPDGWVQRDPRDPLSNVYQFSNFGFVLRRRWVVRKTAAVRIGSYLDNAGAEFGIDLPFQRCAFVVGLIDAPCHIDEALSEILRAFVVPDVVFQAPEGFV